MVAGYKIIELECADSYELYNQILVELLEQWRFTNRTYQSILNEMRYKRH